MPNFTLRHGFTAQPLTSAAPQISTGRLGQVHTLHAKPLMTKPPELGGEPPQDPGVHRLKAAPPRRPRRRDSPRIGLIQTVLRQKIPEWSTRFPTVEEMQASIQREKGARKGCADVRSGVGVDQNTQVFHASCWPREAEITGHVTKQSPLGLIFLIPPNYLHFYGKSFRGGGSRPFRFPG